jgi:ABC-type branched-subunit amino acid transport system permease subunit
LFLGLVLPKWLLFMCTMAFANGLVSLGIMLLMRGGVVAFGQGLMSAIGGYTASFDVPKTWAHGRTRAHTECWHHCFANNCALRTVVIALPRHLLLYAHIGAVYGGLRHFGQD